MIEKRSILLKIVAAMQKKQRRTPSGCQPLERKQADFDALHPISSRTSRRSSKASFPDIVAINPAWVHPRCRTRSFAEICSLAAAFRPMLS
jgi:hypothetical protein